MARTDDSVKMEQSSRISQIGCFGVLLVLILLIMIGAVAVRSDLARKRTDAIASLQMMREQVDKTPGVLQRMIAYECGTQAEDAVAEVIILVDSLDPDITQDELDGAMDRVNSAWARIERGCRSSSSNPAFIDLKTELEGVRNRYSVEAGNFQEKAETYNSELHAFPGNFVRWGFERL